jgi:hypothetical protein
VASLRPSVALGFEMSLQPFVAPGKRMRCNKERERHAETSFTQALFEAIGVLWEVQSGSKSSSWHLADMGTCFGDAALCERGLDL